MDFDIVQLGGVEGWIGPDGKPRPRGPRIMVKSLRPDDDVMKLPPELTDPARLHQIAKAG